MGASGEGRGAPGGGPGGEEGAEGARIAGFHWFFPINPASEGSRRASVQWKRTVLRGEGGGLAPSTGSCLPGIKRRVLEASVQSLLSSSSSLCSRK